jgi:hypothetical protein
MDQNYYSLVIKKSYQQNAKCKMPLPLEVRKSIYSSILCSIYVFLNQINQLCGDFRCQMLGKETFL